MKPKEVQIGQYAYETKYSKGDNDEFLESIAPKIGYIVYEFNSLEERLTSFICQLINERTDAIGLIITYKMTYYSKVELFSRYTTWVQEMCNKTIPIHKGFIERLKKCGRLRNMVVHAEWDSIDLDGYAFVKLKIGKNGIHQEYVQFDLESLEKIKNLIVEVNNRVVVT